MLLWRWSYGALSLKLLSKMLAPNTWTYIRCWTCACTDHQRLWAGVPPGLRLWLAQHLLCWYDFWTSSLSLQLYMYATIKVCAPCTWSCTYWCLRLERKPWANTICCRAHFASVVLAGANDKYPWKQCIVVSADEWKRSVFGAATNLVDPNPDPDLLPTRIQYMRSGFVKKIGLLNF